MKKLLVLFGICLTAYTCSKSDDNSPLTPVKYTVSVSASEGGSVNTTGGQYNENTSVSISATPDQGYEFSGWIGTALSGSNISVNVTSNQTITANFIRSIYTLTVDTVGNGEVTQQLINSGRGTEEYESGNTIRLSATPESDFLFYNWGYLRNNTNENNYENPLEVKMDRSKTVTATFEQKLPIINPDNTDKNNTVGKWKIRKKGPGTKRFSDRAVNCEVNEIIIRSDNSFTIITETSTITGQYTIDSDTSISLNQGGKTIGSLTELVLTENFISFNINLIEVCDEQLEADKDPTYDEATDPIAPSNTGTTSSTGGENNSETTTSTTSSDTSNTGTTTSTSGNGGSNAGTTSSTGGENNSETTTSTTSSDTTNTGTTTSTSGNGGSNTGTTSSTGGENNSETTTSTTSSDTTNTGTTTSTSGNGGSNTGTTSSTGGGGNNSGNTSSTSANISQEPLSFNIQVLLFENNSSDYRVLLNEDRLGGLNGDADPDLDFYIGDSISFEIDTPGHPFYLKTIQGTGTEDLINGVSNNGATSGTISWTPTTTGTYYYQCSIHNGMYGTITVN
ncbi:MAG: hypothetical protein ISP66_02055 [Flavobacteriaceae bacterium]|nr:hypothetical protein [Flavobacteriaceae bacterium]